MRLVAKFTYEVGRKSYEPGCTKNCGVSLKKMRSAAEQRRSVSTIMRQVAPPKNYGVSSRDAPIIPE